VEKLLRFCDLDLAIEIGERLFEHLMQTLIVGVLQLLDNTLT
jgi:hypothetical protein